MRVARHVRHVSGGLLRPATKADVGETAGTLLAQGYDLLAWADPFFPDRSLPRSVREAMVAEIERGSAEHYTMPVGALDLRRALADKVAKVNGLTVDPQRNLMVTPGSDSGLLLALLPLIEPGDEVLVPDPSYPSNARDVELLGGVPVTVELDPAAGFQLDVARFEAARTDRTRVVLLTHPNNPTGTVFRRERLEALARWIVEHDLMLVCDQAFEDHVYDGLEMVTPAALPGMWARTVTVFSLSKGLGLSGLRVGYLVADEALMDFYYGAAVNVVGATSTVSQAGALAALTDPTIVPGVRDALLAHRDIAWQELGQIEGVRATWPESGFLLWLDVSSLGSGADVAAHVLDSARVIVNDGAAYGASGAGCLRIVFGCYRDSERLRAVLRRVRSALEELRAATT
ncbi:pyridoxal phosphate-dependent aminotransferase [Miniimonas sp. S16]|uniref:pyridoxal phosphate-dependent aminotransferase n=1 Tax=Miniimonas sp. S16 TaxID=2171623 RepID=UPI000D52656F|nr:pyridoxal phosphate-dependent aminotransferase [Miniimonas sp. S16]